MSADNFLGIYKTDRGEFIGRSCWSECERRGCAFCNHRVIFSVYSLPEAIEKAQKACHDDIYEYGYTFLNFLAGDENGAISDTNKISGGKRMEKFWIIFVEHTNGGRHYRHETLEKAQVEAERLVRLPENIGMRVYIFGCEGRCQVEATPVKWEIPHKG